MYYWLKRLFVGVPACKHEWVEIYKSDVLSYGKIRAYVFIKECKHCKDMKQFRFNADGIN